MTGEDGKLYKLAYETGSVAAVRTFLFLFSRSRLLALKVLANIRKINRLLPVCYKRIIRKQERVERVVNRLINGEYSIPDET